MEEKVNNNNTTICFHINDINLKALHRDYFSYIDGIVNIDNQTKEFRKAQLQTLISLHCQSNNISFDETTLILIRPENLPNPDQYFFYIAISLVCKPMYAIEDYLNYHFSSYPYDPQDFLERIKHFVIDYTQSITPIDNYPLREKIMNWVYSLSSYKQPTDANDIEELFIKEAAKEIPIDYDVTNFRISRLNIMKFFSFLFEFKTKNGEPMMTIEDFVEVFRYGIALPPNPKKELIKLNMQGVFIGNINSAIYQFFHTYERGISQKQSIMKFMAYHFEPFNEYTASKKEFLNWSKNLRNKKPQKGNFKLPDIPAQ